MPSIILIKSPGGSATGQTYPLDRGDAFVIGRDQELCQIVIPNSSVSRQHAQIIRQNGQLMIDDCKSRNGTFVNQTKVMSPVALKNEDRIKICDFLFRYHDERIAQPSRQKPEVMVEDPDEPPDMTTVQHTVTSKAAEQFLEVQPSDKLRALLEISTKLSKTLDLDALLPQVADILFGVFKQADRCFIIVLDDSGRMIPKVVKARRPGGGEDHRFSKTIVKKCLDSNQAYLSEDASSDTALASQSIAEFRIRSVMCAPLVTSEGRRLGALQLDTQDVGKKFKEEDLKWLTIVANFATVAIEKAQAIASLLAREKERKEIEVARKVQVGFLPKTFPELLGYEFFAFYSPAQSVGGDYYDFIKLSQGRVAVVLGDVAGKGVAAALLMAKLSAEVRYCMRSEPDPANAVALLNEELINGGIGDRFVTFAALIIDPVAHQITIVNAGHINPVKLPSSGGEMVEVISNQESGLPLGLVNGYVFAMKVFSLEVGECVILFTDGVPDAENPALERFGFDGIQRAVQTDSILAAEPRPSVIGDRLVKAVQRHSNGFPQSDDIALVCFGRVEGGPSTGSSLMPRIIEPNSGGMRDTPPAS